MYRVVFIAFPGLFYTLYSRILFPKPHHFCGQKVNFCKVLWVLQRRAKVFFIPIRHLGGGLLQAPVSLQTSVSSPISEYPLPHVK